MKDSDGNMIPEDKLKEACIAVAYKYRKQAIDIFNEDHYAPHVTLEQKLDNVSSTFILAEHIEMMDFGMYSFKTWQDINEYITGECVALLPK